jgi:hypothetical protein
VKHDTKGRILMRDVEKTKLLSRRTRRELRTVQVMISIYCRGHHGTGQYLCAECRELWDYTRRRVERCPFGAEKPTCLNCTVHCFKPELRRRIREMMRYAGPRMPGRHPVLTLFHFIDGRRPTPARKPGASSKR